MENVIIIGSGPAGLTAAIYNARANIKPLMIEGYQTGGQLMLTTDVENFPGFPEGVTGPDLMYNMRKQAEKFGTRFISKNVTKVEKNTDGTFKVWIEKESYDTRAIIISTGASARWLGIEGEESYKGKGLTACATCDGAFYKEMDVIVVGGGDTAMEEALFLTRFCSKVTIVHRRDEFRASKIMADRALAHPKIEVLWNKQVTQILGNGTEVQAVKLEDTQTGESSEFKTQGIFMAIGHTPNTEIFKGIVDLDEHGYVATDAHTKTNVPGIFACGDVQDTIYKQAITAAGSGCQAALEVERYLEE